MIEIRNSLGKTVALLFPEDGLKDAEINNTLNGECTLSFSLPIDQDKRLYLDENCTICAGEKEFVILTPDAKERVREGKSKWERITAHESWVLLGKQYTTISNDPENTDPVPLSVEILSGGTPYPGCTAGSAKSALSYLLTGTGWTAGIVDVEGIHDLETEKESVLANINKIQQTWGGYLIWDSKNRKVNLRDEEKWQVYTGYQIRYAKNLKGITRTDDYNIVTRLYPFGEDDLDIRTVNNDILYLENFSYTNRALEDTWTNQEIDDPQELKDAATRELARLCKPRHNYQVEHIDLRNVDKYEYISLTMPGLFPKIETGPHRHETFTIGNMVDIIDEELGINTRARIIHHRYDLIHDWICDVEIGDPLEDLKATIASTVESSEFINKALRPNTSIGNLLKGFVNTFSTKINSANGRLLWDDGVFEAVEVDENGDLTGRRVRLTSGGVGISNDYGESYVTAMTGDGILANTIICSALYALSSGDGYTQMVGDGLRVHDAQGNLRAHIGTYGDGKYGVKIIGGEVSSDTSIAGHSAADLETQDGAQQKASDAEQNAKTYTRTIIEQTENAIALKADKTTVDGLETRLSQAELKVQPGAIVSTVRSSTEYTNDLGLKVNKNQIISTINQSPESVTISASKINLSGYVTFTSLGGLAFKDNVSYSEVTGSKPPTDADNTQTTIDGGLVTTGTLQLQNANGYVYSGITASGTTSTSVRIWAGDNFDNRAVAPFRVLQSGEVRIGGSSASSPNVKILSNGSFYAGMGGGSRYYFQVPYNADGVYNCFKPSFSNYAAARWKRDDSNYIYQDPETWLVKMGGATRLELYQPNPPHVNLFIGEYNESTTPTVFKGATLKALCESTSLLQVRSANDSAYIPIAASDFVTASKREYKEDIKLAESALKQVLETPVYNFAMKDEGRPRIGLVYEEAPETLRSMDGLSISDMVGMLWKAVQELNSKVDGLLS
jgi:phage minor structural protein